MIHLYTVSSNSSCRSARAFLEEHGLPFTEKRMNSKDMTFGEIVTIAKLAGGTKNIVTKKSKFYRGYEDLLRNKHTTIFQLYDYLLKHPRMIKAPIIYDESRFLIGYSIEEIRMFLPRTKKIKINKDMLNKARSLDEATFT